MRICVIFNPTARGERAARFRKLLEKLPGSCTLKATSASGDARALSAEAVEEEFDVVVAAGGDGTVNEVANGIADVTGGLERARMAVVPLGTVNVFAKELAIPSAPGRAWKVVTQGHEETIDLGEATFREEGVARRRCFVQLAGSGVDWSAIERVDWQHKKRYGPMAYVVAGLKAVAGSKQTIRVSGGGRILEGELVLVGNGRYYGGRFNLFPHGDCRDGLLEVSVFPTVNAQSILRCGWGLLADRLYASGSALHLRAATVELSSDGPVGFQLDGDSVGMLPVTLTVRPRALRILCPKGRFHPGEVRTRGH